MKIKYQFKNYMKPLIVIAGLQTNDSTGSTGENSYVSWSHKHMIWLHHFV